ncbi:MBL fold metallo-hydrolase, partial [uncultured Nevskia sp.]|uniref:MBL fold metallo-hydrolase n=1 Tax=uncultured Nevskia sp. TaxID=228950 RepID=UPI0025F9806F
VGLINARNEVESVQTWIDNPVLGDTLIESRYSEYRDHDGLRFPAHIVRSQGGHPVLDLQVTDVKLNPQLAFAVPEPVAKADAAIIKVDDSLIAPGVHYLTGGSHHSLAIEQKDHVVVVEAPQHEARSLAVIGKVHELIPGKPIRYLINTHAHFDHAGGLRAYVDEGATIVTHARNRSYYEKAWAAPRTLNPDRLAASNKAASFETFTDLHLLDDGTRKIEIHPIAGNGHNDAFALVYLPAEKLLVEADAYTPLPTTAPLPTSRNPFAENLLDNVQTLKLDVKQIAALHGPGLVPLSSLQAVVTAAK